MDPRWKKWAFEGLALRLLARHPVAAVGVGVATFAVRNWPEISANAVDIAEGAANHLKAKPAKTLFAAAALGAVAAATLPSLAGRILRRA